MPSPPRILIVDDDRSQLALFNDGLLQRGYRVVAASGAPQALELLASTLAQTPADPPNPDRIDLVILDILMPGVDGTEVLEHIRRALPSHALPVIMATSKDDPEDIVEALRAGANDYVTKPINLQVLLARVETQLALRKTHRDLRDAQQSLIHAARMESVAHLTAGITQKVLEPCARIASGLQILQSRAPLTEDPQLAAALQSISDSVKNAQLVLERLTKFSAEDYLDLQPRDASQAAEQAIALLQTELADADIYVETEFDPALPAALFSIEELRQVLVIVILNAIEAMPDLGSIMVRTSVQVAEEASLSSVSAAHSGILRGDEVVCIEVLDSGTGLANDDPQLPFNAFYTSKRSSSSVGLGLTIAKKLMDLHGGLIKIANRRGEEGACVTLSLRVAEHPVQTDSEALGLAE